jgi:hypothetical protein
MATSTPINTQVHKKSLITASMPASLCVSVFFLGGHDSSSMPLPAGTLAVVPLPQC